MCAEVQTYCTDAAACTFFQENLIYCYFTIAAVYRLKDPPVCLLMNPMKPLQRK